MKAKTDGGPAEKNSVKPEYIGNIFALMKLVSNTDTADKYERAFNDTGIRYGDMKKELAEDMVNFIAPIRQKAQDLLSDEKKLQQILQHGAEKARKSAVITMEIVRDSMGLTY